MSILLGLILLYVVVCIVYLTNRIVLSRYTWQRVTIEDDLEGIFRRFCEEEEKGDLRIIIARSFWYRPHSNTIGVKQLTSNDIVDALSFVHELYHFKDRRRLLRIQTFISLYVYLFSTTLKLTGLYCLFLHKSFPLILFLLTIDVVLLIVCCILTVVIEQFASKNAILFLQKHQYVKTTKTINKISLLSLLNHVIVFLAYILSSLILLVLSLSIYLG